MLFLKIIMKETTKAVRLFCQIYVLTYLDIECAQITALCKKTDVDLYSTAKYLKENLLLYKNPKVIK